MHTTTLLCIARIGALTGHNASVRLGRLSGVTRYASVGKGGQPLSLLVRYNALVDSEELRSEISTTHLQNLAEIFVKYNVHERLRVHLIHGHVKVAADNVMLGHSFTEPSDVHGHIFKLVDGGHFVAYEYVEGKASDLSDISTDFFKDLVEYLKSHQLEATVGLQILGQSARNIAEFDFGDCGTVMLKEQDIYYATPFRTVGWVFTCKEGFASFKGNETHMETVKGTHKVLIDIKLALNITALKAILKRFKVVN
ncbi:hypothetical protein G7Y89_g12526 [Cudoniella acicularis]|uniref:Uncharacterized protein n=1 Tax=Cudoniella acicularis TaxID=354080 RepID=A0A8H4R8N0_9HELO|nr:hypothetical protein G7Y89_g12526 [Cudoniella acicularis]